MCSDGDRWCDSPLILEIAARVVGEARTNSNLREKCLEFYKAAAAF